MIRRISIVTDAWHPQVNGAVRVLTMLQNLLEKRGYTVTIIEPQQFMTVPFPFLPEAPLAVFPRQKLRRLLKASKPDAVHITTEGTLGLAARSVCKSENIPFTTSYHTHFQLYLKARVGDFFTKLAYAYLRWFHSAAVRTMIATESESLRKELSIVGFKHLVSWPLGVDTELFVRNEKPNLPPLKSPVFAYCGRLAPEKSVDEFLALSLPGTKLVIGDGPDRAALEKRFPHAHFVGYQHGQALVDWLSCANVLVFPSRTETFGLVIIEALACGVPVAAHNVMGPSDIITQGVDGYLSEDLGEAALKALTLSREACRKTALRYTWNRSVDIFVKNLVPCV